MLEQNMIKSHWNSLVFNNLPIICPFENFGGCQFNVMDWGLSSFLTAVKSLGGDAGFASWVLFVTSKLHALSNWP